MGETMPQPQKKPEPKKYDGPNLRELDDDELADYMQVYPGNVHLKGEYQRRRQEKINTRQTRTVG